jgi:hypothetical protein
LAVETAQNALILTEYYAEKKLAVLSGARLLNERNLNEKILNHMRSVSSGCVSASDLKRARIVHSAEIGRSYLDRLVLRGDLKKTEESPIGGGPLKIRYYLKAFAPFEPATNATNVAIVDDTTTATTVYPVWANNTSGNQALETSSTKLSFVPSTGVLTATSFAGAGTGLTGTASSLSIGGTATTATTANATNTSNNFQMNSLGVGTAGSGTAGEIRATNNVTAFYSSDIKFKENIRQIDNAIEKVNIIGGKYFDWTDKYINSKGGADGYFNRKADIGVIAQDVIKVLPEAVRTRDDGSLAVDYQKLISLAFAAIVELKAEVELLKAR